MRVNPPAASMAARLGSRRHVAWLGGLVLVAIVAQAGFEVWRSHGRAVQTIERDLDAQARVIAEQTARAVQTIDVVLENLVEQLQRGALTRAGPDELHAYLRERAKGLVQSDGLVVFAPDGSLRATSQVNAARLPPRNFADDGPFAHIRDHTRGELHIHPTLLSPEIRRWVFPIGRRLVDAQGRFAGVVGGVGRVDYFQQFYAESYADPSTRISLMHRNGVLLARHPPTETALGRKIQGVDALLPPSASAPATARRFPSPVDGIDHFVVLRLVPDYPLAVAVSRDATAALAPWRAQAIATAWRTLALTALAAWLLVVVVRQIARLAASRAALETSEARYALAMTGSDEGHWLWNIPEHRIYASARLIELLGLEGGAQELRDDEYFASIPLHPDDRERVHHNRNEHVAGRTPRLDHEFRIVVPGSGEVRWLHTRAQCFRDAAGQPMRLAGSTVDITQRKLAEEALRASGQRFADAVAGSDDGIWEWDYTTGMAFGSRRGRQILGLPPEPEVLPMDQWAAEMAGQIHPDDIPLRQAAIDDHLAGRKAAYECDFRARQPDGSWRWVHVHGRAVRDAEGRLIRLAGSAKDIDDRKRAEVALRESEERYALAMAGSRGGHWVWEAAADKLFVSPTVNQLFGLPPGTQPASRTAYAGWLRVHPDDRLRVGQLMEALAAGPEARADYELRVVLPDGTTRWILNRAQRFAAADGHHGVRIAGVSVDITERKQAEAEREQLAQQLRQAQKLEAIGTLAGGIAHDFNNILSAILGYGELVQREAPEGTPLRRHIDAAMSAGHRAKSLVQRILAFSRGGLGERHPVHVRTVLDEALDAVAAGLPPGVRLVREVNVSDAGVLGDATELHQVVMNLTANAVQAMKGEGELAVRAERLTLAEPLALATRTLLAGSYVRLTVQDSGAGMAPELLERIFDPFFTTKEVGVGTGLGLSLVHRIVTDLAGGIAVQSEPGRGSTFTVWLPSQPYAGAPAVAAAEAPAARGEGQVVLLVDDEESLVRLGEEMLAELGYEPVGFNSSLEALEALRAEPARFDLMLSDEAMPGMTGSELAAEARRLKPRMPIVLMTGFASPALVQRSRELGVAEVLTKPLAARDIARCLAAALH